MATENLLSNYSLKSIKERLVTELEISHRYFRDMQMVNTHLKMLNVYVIRDVQDKQGHYYKSIKMTEIQNADNTKCRQRCGTSGKFTY